jgi:hypothetical protein
VEQSVVVSEQGKSAASALAAHHLSMKDFALCGLHCACVAHGSTQSSSWLVKFRQEGPCVAHLSACYTNLQH